MCSGGNNGIFAAALARLGDNPFFCGGGGLILAAGPDAFISHTLASVGVPGWPLV